MVDSLIGLIIDLLIFFSLKVYELFCKMGMHTNLVQQPCQVVFFVIIIISIVIIILIILLG